jgi:hypothetical protein
MYEKIIDQTNMQKVIRQNITQPLEKDSLRCGRFKDMRAVPVILR